jgi:crotonobetainyl-CoA:carnitine CoA-transferase CaiB-like acyl-CoA transferase
VRRTASQAVGQDNAEVYAERLGLSATDLAALKAKGIV